MDFKLSEELQAIRETARDFAEKEIVSLCGEVGIRTLFPPRSDQKDGRPGFLRDPHSRRVRGQRHGLFGRNDHHGGNRPRQRFPARYFQHANLRPGPFHLAVWHGGAEEKIHSHLGLHRTDQLLRHHRTQRRLGCHVHEDDGHPQGGLFFGQRSQDLDFQRPGGRSLHPVRLP